jgi:hypothetical protein
MVADWCTENLRLTYDFFQNNVTDDLFLKVSETYDKFPRSQRGGPLFFILMLNQLLADTEEAAISLQKRVKDFKITNIPGEDIRKVVSLLRGAVNRLTYINKIPEDLVKTMLAVMQTSSVDSFNETFHLIEKERKHHAILRKTGFHATLTVDDIFCIAEAEYRDLGENSQWTGVHSSGQSSAFNAANSPPRAWTPTCFNCGGPHSNKECPKPADPTRITAAVKKFREDKRAREKAKAKQGGGSNGGGSGSTGEKMPGTGNWSRPKPHEKNRRLIKDKPFTWSEAKKRWYPERTNSAPPAAPAAHTANHGTPTPDATPSTPQRDTPNKQHMIQLACANTAKTVNAAFASLAQQFGEDE